MTEFNIASESAIAAVTANTAFDAYDADNTRRIKKVTASQLYTITPPYAGAGVQSAALTFSAPSPITAVTHTLGYGSTTAEIGELTLTSSGVANNNAFAIANNNAQGFAAITFRGRDFGAVDTTEVFEHGGVGWVPTGLSNVGFFIVEASSLPATASFLPPPTLLLAQTGAIDPTGGVNVVCTTNGTTTLSAAANATTNGQHIYGQDIPPNTTIASGGGTTTIIMSQAATGSHAGSTINFCTPVLLQRKVMDATPTANVNFRGFSNEIILAIDRINDRLGINTTTPAFTLDVNGAAQLNGALNFAGGGSVTGGAGVALSFVAGNHIAQLTDNVAGIAAFKVANASAAASQASYQASTGTANSSMSLSLLDQSGSPIILFSAGSAVGNWLMRPAALFVQTTGGATDFTVTPGSAVSCTSPFTACVGTAIPANGAAGKGLLVSSTANFGVFFGSGAPSISAAQGSIYLRSDGSSTSTRLYVNTTGSTTWTNVTTAA